MHTIQCTCCLSINHLNDTWCQAEWEAWECYGCGSRYWRDDWYRDQYKTLHNTTDQETDSLMEEADSSIFFLSGNYE
jgi:uncharacterized protein with PIN domain